MSRQCADCQKADILLLRKCPECGDKLCSPCYERRAEGATSMACNLFGGNGWCGKCTQSAYDRDSELFDRYDPDDRYEPEDMDEWQDETLLAQKTEEKPVEREPTGQLTGRRDDPAPSLPSGAVEKNSLLLASMEDRDRDDRDSRNNRPKADFPPPLRLEFLANPTAEGHGERGHPNRAHTPQGPPPDRAPLPTNFLRVFVGGTTRDTTRDDLRGYFSSLRFTVLEASIIRHKETQHSLGYGFVSLQERHRAEEVFRMHHVIKGKPVDVKPAVGVPQSRGNSPTNKVESPEPTKVFVGQLLYDATAELVHAALSKFGRIIAVEVMTEKSSVDCGRNRCVGYGFATFADHRAAEVALRQGETEMPRGAKGGICTVRRAQHRREREVQQPVQGRERDRDREREREDSRGPSQRDQRSSSRITAGHCEGSRGSPHRGQPSRTTSRADPPESHLFPSGCETGGTEEEGQLGASRLDHVEESGVKWPSTEYR
mmetsp:Transcript_12330/g.23914  ORF Transcript_12330/g.23914 Transcript_12330/m.23914 type:complete len:487 (-) Transcript_12330:57-1517(-)